MAQPNPRDQAHKKYAQASRPPSFPIVQYAPDSKNSDDQSNQKDEANEQSMSKLYQYVFAGKSGVWTALATVAMCVFSFFLYRVSEEANANNVASQRAMLSTSLSPWIKSPNPDGKTIKGYQLYLQFFNSGSVPAKGAFGQFNVATGDEIPDKSLDFGSLPQVKTQNFIVGPKGVAQLFPVFVSLDDLIAVSEGRKHLFFWSWTTYNDGYPDTPRRLTESCVEVSAVTWTKPDRADITTEAQVNQPLCAAYNCYDEDCPDYKNRTR